jgi:transposase
MARKRKNNKKISAPVLHCLNPNAAGVDVGATEIYIAVPVDRDAQPVRHFSTFTEDLHAAADWLKACNIETVAMESTGVYWIPLFQILEARGLQVFLVNARHVKNVPGRKSDVSDCQWLQYLHCICIRWVCCADRSGQNRRYARCAPSFGIGTVWCKWLPVTSNTCKRLWIR